MECMVSIVTPCYNGSRFIDLYMKGIMEQTYHNIELIIIDDGSVDNSFEKLKNWKEKLKHKGIKYILLHKENGGQPSAINEGMKYASGKYVTWPDIDDLMHKDYIEKKTEFMEKNQDIDLVISKSAVIRLSDPAHILSYTWPERVVDNKELMKRILKDENIWYEPGAFMARLNSFDKFIQNRKIYEQCGVWSGPQTQILMPFFYKGKIGYLNECLYNYYLHDKQDHCKVKSREDFDFKYKEVEKMLIATIKSLGADKISEQRMIYTIKERIIRTQCCVAFQREDREWFMSIYKQFEKKQITIKDKFRYYIIKYRLICLLFKVFRKIKPSKNYIRY